MTVLNKYKVFCETDNKWEYTWRADTEAAPAECPINHEHTIRTSSVSIDEMVNDQVPKVEVSATPPFAVPTFRTKWDGSPVQDIAVTNGEATFVDFKITEERYVNGGEIVYENMKIGDWMEGMIVDKDAVIPAPYRSAAVGLCEAWPIVATYILHYNIPAGNGARMLNTYPLNAKVTPGLYLRVVIHTTPEESNRKLGVNYYLAKKL